MLDATTGKALVTYRLDRPAHFLVKEDGTVLFNDHDRLMAIRIFEDEAAAAQWTLECGLDTEAVDPSRLRIQTSDRHVVVGAIKLPVRGRAATAP